jgi:xanthine dehydrogenase small subunit
VRYKAVNSCIKLAHSIDGQALWTVEDLSTDPLLQPPAGLHPAQEAMVQCHGSQCGFCTPGFVMSLFGMYQNHIASTLTTSCGSLPPEGAAAPADWQSQIRGPGLKGTSNPITRELVQQELSGNLCRCTGYRPIFDAAQQMAALPTVQVDEAALLSKMELIAPAQKGLEADLAYNAPRTLPALLTARAAHPGAQLVAGCTDVGLWVTKMHKQFGQVLDVTRVEELRRIERYERHIAIGAAVTLSDAFAALVADRPQLHTFAQRFAGLPVRNAGTLGGNVANGSPIGDSMPLLIALGAHVVLLSQRGHREMPLEQLYTGYRQNVMAPDEVLAWIKVPLPAPHQMLKAYKISKRYDDDISAVCLVIRLELEGEKVAAIGMGAGGVAATPARAVRTEAFLRGRSWTEATVREAMATLRGEFKPLSDMRASAAYRSEVLGNLLQRFWLESQGVQQINLERFVLEEAQPS